MRLLFTGDIMLGRLVNEALEQLPPAYPWGDTLDLFRQADWRMCNLECAISDRGSPWSVTPKVFHFRSDAKNIAVLTSAQIHAVSLANNHALDYDTPALLDTLDLLDQHGVARAGAGRNAGEAARAAVCDVGGTRVGVVAFTDNMPEWEAGDGPGVYFVPVATEDGRARQLLARVRRTAAEVDVLIVSAHWGPNWGRTPPPSHVELGRALVDAGADVVFGHSAHILRGVEFYKDRPILYSTGDFIDDYAVDPIERNDWSCVFVVSPADAGAWSVGLHPTVIHRYQARLAPEPDRTRIVSRMTTLCAAMNTAAHWDAKRARLELSPAVS